MKHEKNNRIENKINKNTLVTLKIAVKIAFLQQFKKKLISLYASQYVSEHGDYVLINFLRIGVLFS